MLANIDVKCRFQFVMAMELGKLLVKHLSMLWRFIITCFVYFLTLVQKEKPHRCEFSEFLQWKEEEMIKMQTILRRDDVLNKRQCTSLVTKLSTTMHSIIEMITSNQAILRSKDSGDGVASCHTKRGSIGE